MKTKQRISRLSASIGAALFMAAAFSPVYAGELKTSQKPVEGQYIVKLKDGAARMANESGRVGTAQVSTVARDVAATHRANLVRSFDHVLRGFVVKADDKALARLLADPRVEYVEEDGYVYANATQTGATWGLDRVDQRNLPLNGTYIYNTTASTVRAYIIDTGVLGTHSQFSGRMGNGFTAINDGRGTTDCNGHGTHVAGTVGGTTWGVAKAVKIHPVRVLGCTGSGTWSGVIAGLDWVRANHVKPAVANMSLGGGISSSVDTATNNLINAGVTVVVAAGNGNVNACNSSPARVPNAITVGATDRYDARSLWPGGQGSSFGSCLDIFAPGTNITSAWHTSTTASNTISGTSMASPHVAGAAALYLATNPTASPTTVRNAIVNNATLNKVTNAGSGSPNRLLYTLFGTSPGTRPVINSLSCYSSSSATGDYDCYVSYSSATSATVSWSGGYGTRSGSWYYRVCGDGVLLPYATKTLAAQPQRDLIPIPIDGYPVTVRATVTNAFGSVNSSRTVICTGGLYQP